MSRVEKEALTEMRRGARTLIGAMALYGGSPIIILQTAGVFVQPTADSTGLPTSAISIGPIVLLLLALSQPFVGLLLNKYGPRRLAIIAMVSMVIGLGALILVPPSGASFYAIGVFLGLGGSLGYAATFTKLVSMWFRKNYGLAVGIVGGAASLTPLAAIPVISAVIYGTGEWRAGYAVLVAFVLLVCLPTVVWGVREPKEPLFEKTDRTSSNESGLALARVLSTGRFWSLMMSFVIVNFAVGGFLANLQPMLLSQGIDVTVATAMSMVLLVGVLVGRIAGGFLLDRIPPYLVPLGILTLSGAAALLVVTVNNSFAVAFVVLIVFVLGLSQGAEADFPAFFLLREFGARSFAVAAGIAFMIFGVAGSAGGIGFAMVRDTTGEYSAIATLAGTCYFFGAALMGLCWILSARARKLARAASSTDDRQDDRQSLPSVQ